MIDIETNLKEVYERIEVAAKRAGRNPEEIKLIAVSKTKPVEYINKAVSLGVTDIGENKVQEVMDKYDCSDPVNWHFIGHLQRNKVKYIIDKVSMIHSVDSLRLAKEIDHRAKSKDLVMDVLIQVNSAEEESKFGISLNETIPLMEEILEQCPNIRIQGLMCIAPAAENPDDIRIYFRQVRDLFQKITSEMEHENLNMKYLSMGMTHDFEAAIMEGSNMVRVGTAIFGERNYSK